jgi:hypothetical protein
MTPRDDDALLAQADQHWLAVGLRMGLEQPDDARRILARIERPWQADATSAGALATDGTLAAEAHAAPKPGDETGTDDVLAGLPDHPDMPATSMLLVRSATMPADQQAEVGPDIVWGWAARLSPAEVALLGRVVQQMLDEGAPANVGRGFGIAWTDGVKLPVAALDLMFKQFVELEHTVASVIAGRDIRASSTAGPRSIADTLAGWFGRPDSGSAQAGAVIEGAGRPAQLGIVAMWNTWVGVRFRASIPKQTFELLVRPWTTVVGPLPDA